MHPSEIVNVIRVLIISLISVYSRAINDTSKLTRDVAETLQLCDIIGMSPTPLWLEQARINTNHKLGGIHLLQILFS